MTPEVTASYRWTIDELLAGTRAHYRALYPRFVRLVWLGAGAMTLLAGIVSAMQVGVSRAFLPLFAGSFLLLHFTVIQPLVLRVTFRRRPDKNAELAWVFNPDRISNTGWGGKTELQWDALAKVVQVKDGLLFYPTSRVFSWVPNHAFQNEVALEQVTQWAEQKARVFRRKVKR